MIMMIITIIAVIIIKVVIIIKILIIIQTTSKVYCCLERWQARNTLT